MRKVRAALLVGLGAFVGVCTLGGAALVGCGDDTQAIPGYDASVDHVVTFDGPTPFDVHQDTSADAPTEAASDGSSPDAADAAGDAADGGGDAAGDGSNDAAGDAAGDGSGDDGAVDAPSDTGTG